MICSSVNLDRFIFHLPSGDGLYLNMVEDSGLTSAYLLARIDTEFAGRAYAAYGGIYIISSLA
tara:strand:- start:17123 stop:17311 length:189 start_codon:yes stop_codon:yes gene_type:complete